MSRVPVPNDWDGSTYCCRIIQWPNSVAWNAILFGLISWPMRGRFWDERTGTITDAQATGADIYDRNITDGGCLLGCIGDLQDSLDRIAAALENPAGCGDCPPGATGQTPEPSGDIGDDANDAPPGYNQELYTGDEKCSVANWYWQQSILVVQSLLDYNIVAWLTAGVSLAITAILAVLGLAELALFGGIILQQLGALTDMIEALLPLDTDDLQAVVDELEADQAGFVCELYTAGDVDEAAANISTWGTAAGLTANQQALLVSILNPYVLAGLFYVSDETLTEATDMTGKVNCLTCGVPGECLLEIDSGFGTGTITHDGEEFTLTSEDQGSYHSLAVAVGASCSGHNWCVRFVGSTIDTNSQEYGRLLYAKDAIGSAPAHEYQYDTPSFPSFNRDYPIVRLVFADAYEFTVTMKINAFVGPTAEGDDPEDSDICA